MHNKILYTAKFTHHDLKFHKVWWKLVRRDSYIPPQTMFAGGIYIKLVRILKQNFNQLVRHTKNRRLVRVMVFHATFNNISVISWRSFLLVEETGLSGENRRPAASNWQSLSHNVVSSTPRHVSYSNSL